ncbi:MAG: tetratricopeptide repeat protein [Bacteriovoracia bacterium]
MKYLLFFIFIALVGCAGAPTKTDNKPVDAAAGIAVTNKDFAKKNAISYTASQDYYPVKQESKNVLITESADKADPSELKELLAGKDPLTVMMTSCYAKDFNRAFAIAESIFDTHMKLPSYWNQVATCHLLQGNERKALLFYNKALEVKPNYVPALNNIGVIYSKSAQDQKAQVAIRRALSNGKFTRTPRYNLAFLLLKFGLADESSNLFQGLLNDAPKDVELRIGYANSLALQGRWQDSWAQFSLIPANLRERSDVGLNMALVAHSLGKTDDARKILGATSASGEARSYLSALKKVIGD